MYAFGRQYIRAFAMRVAHQIRNLIKTDLKITTIIMSIVALTLSGQAVAATLTVDGADAACDDVAGTPYCTIQAAIDAAVSGADTVEVRPATYQENINFSGKAITVMSTAGAASTIIDGGAADTVAFFGNGEGTTSVLQGFTLRNGRAIVGQGLANLGEGGGIYINDSSPTVRNNIITNNVSDFPGIGIAVESGGSPIIDGNTISDNSLSNCCTGGLGGAGISLAGTVSPQIVNNVIRDNFIDPGNWVGAGGIDLRSAGTPTIQNNLISGNTGRFGGGIRISNSDPLIIQNVIVGNTAAEGGGIHWVVAIGEPSPIVVNNTIADNNSAQGSGVFADGSDALAELTNNVIIGRSGQTAVFCGDFNDLNPPIFNSNDVFTAGGTAYGGICTDQTGINGNISADPTFLDPVQSDYRLNFGSPVIDAGDSTEPNIPATDFLGNARIVDGDGTAPADVDMGAYEFSPNPGFFDFTVATYVVAEEAVSATITVSRKGGQTGMVNVDFATSDGTATAGSDYTASAGTLTFADGDVVDKTFSVLIIDDSVFEAIETINLTLSNPTGGATLGTLTSAVLAILTSDFPGTPAASPPSTSGSSSDCFIATAAYGTPMAEEIRYLRAFRDGYLLPNRIGRRFVELYYRYSPPIADYISQRQQLRRVVRVALMPLVTLSKWLVGDRIADNSHHTLR